MAYKNKKKELRQTPIQLNILELYTNSVFLVGIRLVFLGILPTDTGGKLGCISVLKKWREPYYTQKMGPCVSASGVRLRTTPNYPDKDV
jgi:hypothetical protein